MLTGGVLDSGEAVRAGDSPAQSSRESESREYGIKAAFLLNFVRYTTWPKHCFEDEQAPIVLTVVGRDPFGEILESTFKGEQVNGRRIAVRRLAEVPEKIEGHVVFCGEVSDEQRGRLIERCAEHSVLLLGERPGFAQDGACINFYPSELKVRFEINPDATAAAALEISPAVLKLARIVRSRKER